MAEQGETYAKFIEGELKYEYDRRAALDTRALAVVSTSSGFLALVFALATLILGKDYEFSTGGARGLVFCLATFVAAAGLGLLANRSRSYGVPDSATLTRMIDDKWKDSETSARNICAALNIATIKTLRNGSNAKSRQLVGAFVCQLLAIAGLVLTLGWELRNFY